MSSLRERGFRGLAHARVRVKAIEGVERCRRGFSTPNVGTYYYRKYPLMSELFVSCCVRPTVLMLASSPPVN